MIQQSSVLNASSPASWIEGRNGNIVLSALGPARIGGISAYNKAIEAVPPNGIVRSTTGSELLTSHDHLNLTTELLLNAEDLTRRFLGSSKGVYLLNSGEQIGETSRLFREHAGVETAQLEDFGDEYRYLIKQGHEPNSILVSLGENIPVKSLIDDPTFSDPIVTSNEKWRTDSVELKLATRRANVLRRVITGFVVASLKNSNTNKCFNWDSSYVTTQNAVTAALIDCSKPVRLKQ